MSSAVDLVQGLGVLTGIEVVDVPGATAGFDNDYGAQARRVHRARSTIATSSSCTSRRPTKPGTRAGADIKVDALERWDADIIGPIVDALDARGEPYRILLLPDHATPCDTMTHTADPVPYLLFDSDARRAGRRVHRARDRVDCASGPAHALMAPSRVGAGLSRVRRSVQAAVLVGCKVS